jgi:hypothetical protein
MSAGIMLQEQPEGWNQTAQSEAAPEALLNGSEHFDDVNRGTYMQLKEQQQEMMFFLATSFMIWLLQRVLFVQHLLLGGTTR